MGLKSFRAEKEEGQGGSGDNPAERPDCSNLSDYTPPFCSMRGKNAAGRRRAGALQIARKGRSSIDFFAFLLGALCAFTRNALKGPAIAKRISATLRTIGSSNCPDCVDYF
jgi:hypothetical protein